MVAFSTHSISYPNPWSETSLISVYLFESFNIFKANFSTQRPFTISFLDGSKTGSYRETSSGYNAYDKYGRKTGSYKTGSNGVTTKYDRYGRKTGSFKKDSLGRVTEYDKYGRKVGSYR